MVLFFFKVYFVGSLGDCLVVWLDLLFGFICVYVLFVYCFLCFKDIFVVVWIFKVFIEEGFVVFWFDFIGFGYLEGDFVNINFFFNVGDLIVVVDFFCEEYEVLKFLIGYSFGGVVVVMVVGFILEVIGVVMIGVLVDFEYVIGYFEDSL